jgi:hypothetical protein
VTSPHLTVRCQGIWHRFRAGANEETIRKRLKKRGIAKQGVNLTPCASEQFFAPLDKDVVGELLT